MVPTKNEMVICPPSAPLPDGPKCIDLFSGAGGMAVGFRQAGWAVLAANDFDHDAGCSFRLNFPESYFFEGPIAQLNSAKLMRKCSLRKGELDALIGGPPCQSFSYNNHHRSADGERARLFECYLRLVSELAPKCLVMENVPGILTIGGGSVVAEIRSRLEKMDYDCEVEILSSDEFGTPQVRRRVFIVASRIGNAEELLPDPTHRGGKGRNSENMRLARPITVHKAIGDLPEIGNGGGERVSSYKGRRATTQFQMEARKGSRKLFNHACHQLTKVNLDRMEHVPEGGNWRDIPRDLLTDGMKRARPSDHTKRYGRLARRGLASTILTKCDPHWGAYVHPTQDRTISVREAARLQGFPDEFHFAGESLGPQYQQVGNAVPVPVARALGLAAANHIQNAEWQVLSEAAE